MSGPANDNHPLTLTRAQAAELCQLTPAGFDAWVRKGIVPTAMPGTRMWSRSALVRALSGVAVDVEGMSPFEQWEAKNAGKA